MSKPRFVLDTNLIISAALREKSVSRTVFDTALNLGDILISDATQDELSEVFLRPKFDRFVSQEKRLRFLAGFLQMAIPIAVVEQVQACRDPKDDKFLEVAVNGNAHSLISGDEDLLVLHPFRGTDILSPRDFLTLYEQSK